MKYNEVTKQTPWGIQNQLEGFKPLQKPHTIQICP